MKRILLTIVAGVVLTTFATADDDAPIDSLRHIQGGRGTQAAREALLTVTRGGAKNLMPVLDGFQGADLVGANWLRSAFETIASAELQAGRQLPARQIIAFIRDTSRNPGARRLAYEWLLKQDDSISQKLIPEMLQDPHPDFRRDAVALLIDQAKAADPDRALALYQDALRGAVHDDQVKIIAEALKAAGQPVDLQAHFGFLTEWNIIGPFDNREMKGFAVAYPPESQLDPQATYQGQLGDVTWQPVNTDDEYGMVNIGTQIKNYKGSVMYAVTTYRSASEQHAVLRLGTPNAWKLWLNGQLMFEREEYHRSQQMDQYHVGVTLQPGENTILLKVCQNEQEQDWAQAYQYQLRVSDSSGAALRPAGESSE